MRHIPFPSFTSTFTQEEDLPLLYLPLSDFEHTFASGLHNGWMCGKARLEKKTLLPPRSIFRAYNGRSYVTAATLFLFPHSFSRGRGIFKGKKEHFAVAIVAITVVPLFGSALRINLWHAKLSNFPGQKKLCAENAQIALE